MKGVNAFTGSSALPVERRRRRDRPDDALSALAVDADFGFALVFARSLLEDPAACFFPRRVDDP
jgi:hypothetical protein